ncbi:MAG: hypothetical protein J6Q85_06020 [Clostridia bacterium]|nr:hypothetical protein [Clostridia bacterium]
MSQEPQVTSIRASDGSTVKIEYHKSLPSTSALAREYALAGYPDRYVVFTDAQSCSQITGTRLSEGEYENGIFMSCILRPSFFPSQAGLLGHISTVALVSALDEHTTKNLGIGWVSDVYCDGVRLGGCAVEGKLNSHFSYEYLIVTLAVALNKRDFPPRLTDMIKKVFESESAPLSMLIAKNILNKFFTAYSSIRNPGKYMDAYRRRFILRDKKIKYLSGDKKIRCRIVDVDKENGLLIVEGRRGEKIEIRSPSLVVMPKRVKIK